MREGERERDKKGTGLICIAKLWGFKIMMLKIICLTSKSRNDSVEKIMEK